MTFWGSRSYQVWLTRAPISLSLVLFMLKQQSAVVMRKQRSSTAAVFIINIFQIELIKMVLFSLLKHYSQLLGYMLLTTETIIMVLAIIWGIIASFFWLGWQLTLLFFEVLLSSKIILLVVWLWCLILCSNNRIYSFLTTMCGDRVLHEMFECQMCKNMNCDLLFDKCCHTFHSDCVADVEQYVTAKVCPKCLNQKISKRVYPNIFRTMIRGIKWAKPNLVTLIIYGAVVKGIYDYAQSYWNFPYCFFKG